MNGYFQVATTVRGSGASTPSRERKLACWNAAISLSIPTWAVNLRSSAVTGVPSCQRASGRILQVLNVVPALQQARAGGVQLGNDGLGIAAGWPRRCAWPQPERGRSDPRAERWPAERRPRPGQTAPGALACGSIRGQTPSRRGPWLVSPSSSASGRAAANRGGWTSTRPGSPASRRGSRCPRTSAYRTGASRVRPRGGRRRTPRLRSP